MGSDPVDAQVDEFAREKLARSRDRLERARTEHEAAVRTEKRLAGRVARLESEVAGWAARCGEGA